MALTADDYASFWRDLDYRTQFFDVSGLPASEDRSQYVDMISDIFSKAWIPYAFAAVGSGDALAKRGSLVQKLSGPTAAAAVDAFDQLLRALAASHLSVGGIPDREEIFACFEQFSIDALAPDDDRLARIRADGDPNDFRLDTAQRHTMDGVMSWFVLAATLECATILHPQAGQDNDTRLALAAAVIVGSARDIVVRARGGMTRAEFYPAATGRDATFAKARSLVSDATGLFDEIHALLQIDQGQIPQATEEILRRQSPTYLQSQATLLETPAPEPAGPDFAEIKRYLAKLGAGAAFAPHGKFWEVDYPAFFNGIVPGDDATACNGTPTQILDHAALEQSPFLIALENPTGWCGKRQMPDGGKKLTDPNFKMTMPDGTVMNGAQILERLHIWLRTGAHEHATDPASPL